MIDDWSMVSSALAIRGWAAVRRDAIDMLSCLPDESVDLYATDPAYESLEKHRAKGGTTGRLIHSQRSSNDWFPIFHNDRFPELLFHMYRTLRRNRHAYIVCDDTTSDVIKPMAKDAGFRIWSRLYTKYDDQFEGEPGCDRLIWDKLDIGMGYHWRSRYETIMFLEKGKRKLNHLGWPNVIECKRLRDKNAYPTEKPPELFERLVLNSSHEGELVVDPFCGAAPSGEASRRTGRLWFGIDVVPRALRLTGERLDGL